MDSIVTSEDTIAAIASAISIGKGGVAIIRVSGKDSINSCKKIVKTKSKYAWESHRVFHGFIQENKQNKFIDEVLILVMKSPNSFTGEDVVELHCHGGIILVNKVLKTLLSSDSRVRLANPGEFSQRAFLNGKIDLTQAESINQLINSSNIRSAELAFSGVQGEIKKKIDDIKYDLINQLCEIEARVDFEEDFTSFDYAKYLKNIKKVKKKIESLIENSKRNSYIHNGISIALIGKTNVGKSSLLNLLAKKEKAIVTNIHGTTRDVIEVNLTINEIPMKIIDTAGIRETNEQIENIGIKKSFGKIKESDFIIYIYSLEEGFNEEDKKIIKEIPKEKLITLVGNKKDLIDSKNINSNELKNTILMSIKNNDGEGLLIDTIIKKCGLKQLENINIFLNERHLMNLSACLSNLNDTDEIVKNRLPFDLLSIELRDGIQNLSKITGQELTEELLDNIFSKFCIGK
ncbi:MAG: tRNA uridine-5-carboxymethylaminomethyl(34) synthesis GTPase MnmE [Prochlorococcus marinus CUG1438]|nr:tRNA uridine-5-carboxymethylaminomethyl(34) synthesis GTPase MnmE [Prochlorococcus marinus CUG1438]